MADKIQDFIKHISENKSMAENTCLSYGRDLKTYAQYLSWNHIESIDDGNNDDVKNYISYLDQKGKSSATIARAVVAIKAYYKYIGKQHVTSDVIAPKVVSKKRKTDTAEESENRIQSIIGDRDKAIRDRAILRLIKDTSLKATEVVTLKTEDVDLISCFVRVGRKGHQEYREFSQETRDALREYVDTTRGRMAVSSYIGEMFVNCDGRPMSRQGLWKMIKSYN